MVSSQMDGVRIVRDGDLDVWQQRVGPGIDRETAQAAKAKTSVLRLEGDTALWSVAIRPGQTDAFERVMARLEAALTNSDQPQRRSQAEGWKVVRLNAPLPDGSIVYVHMIHPVVPDANYSIMQILYDEFPMTGVPSTICIVERSIETSRWRLAQCRWTSARTMAPRRPSPRSAFPERIQRESPPVLDWDDRAIRIDDPEGDQPR